MCLRIGILEGHCRSRYGCLEVCVEPRCDWGRNSGGSGDFRWEFGSNFHFWWDLCRVGICVGGDRGRIVLSGTGLDLVGCGGNGTFLGGRCSGFVWGGEEVFVLVHLCQEGRDVGGLMVGEVVGLFECGSRLGKESVVSCTFALSFGFTFLLFRLFGRSYSLGLAVWSLL
jgi:hypothetical protein